MNFRKRKIKNLDSKSAIFCASTFPSVIKYSWLFNAILEEIKLKKRYESEEERRSEGNGNEAVSSSLYTVPLAIKNSLKKIKKIANVSRPHHKSRQLVYKLNFKIILPIYLRAKWTIANLPVLVLVTNEITTDQPSFPESYPQLISVPPFFNRVSHQLQPIRAPVSFIRLFRHPNSLTARLAANRAMHGLSIR